MSFRCMHHAKTGWQAWITAAYVYCCFSLLTAFRVVGLGTNEEAIPRLYQGAKEW